jgi:hypothetical protein
MMTSPGWDVGMAVKEASRTLGDALEEIVGQMQKDGRLAALCSLMAWPGRPRWQRAEDWPKPLRRV